MELMEVEKTELLVKEGYKHTELGIIPEDWISTTFGEVLTGFSSGMTPYRGNPEFYKGTIKWITSGELKYTLITDTKEKITFDAVIKTNLKLLPKGTFLMAITGLEAAGTRGSCGITGIEATTNQSCMALFPTNRIITEYLYHFYVRYGNELAFKYCQGTKQQSYTGKIAKLLPINLPPTLTEQKAIAKALTDINALISNLDKLITKKKAIKQGAMQQLLKSPKQGGKRLPGFEGDWKVEILGDIVSVSVGRDLKDENFSPFKTNVHQYPVFSNTVSNEGLYGFYDKFEYNGESLTVVGRGVGLGTAFKRIGGYGAIGRLLVLFPKENIDAGYLTEYINQRVKIFSESGGIPQLTGISLRKYKILIPPTLAEQKAITTILSEMDAEITNLKKKKAKYQCIKQGMMQELLTGKTRLV